MQEAAPLAVNGLGTGISVLGGSRVAVHSLAFGAVGVGGIATGYLAAGTQRGAVTGALVHMGIFALIGAAFGADRLSPTERWVYAGLGVAAGAGAAYLISSRR